MIDLFPAGFEERTTADGVELAAYAPPVPHRRLAELGAVTEEPVARGWEDRWRRFHRPVRVGPLWVGPPWESPAADAVPVVIDPGRAFGTGAHPSTRLSLELLLACERGSLLDLGCGSGVVAIAGAKLGFAPVTALDADAAAVAAARANAAVNRASVDVHAGDVLVVPLPRAEVAVANIEFGIVERVVERACARIVITSGYLASQVPEPRKWRRRERREADGWAADLFEAL